MQNQTASPAYPESFALARRLKLIAQLIKAGLTTSLYYTQLGGFDTHANQFFTHLTLLREVGDSLKAFLNDRAQLCRPEANATNRAFRRFRFLK